MKRIVSFDVDMTLLDHKDWTIPDSAMRTIEQLRKDCYIVLATGRDMDSIYSTVLRDQVRPDAIIHLNGTKITVGDRIIYEHTFDKKLLNRILDYVETTAHAVGASMEGGDYYIHPEVVKAHDIMLWGECGRMFGDPRRLLEFPVRTMAYIGDDEGVEALRTEFPEVNVHMFADAQGADVVEKCTSKAQGLMRLCEHFEVPVEETVAFGDSMNDYEIIKAAGTGIAMGNAMEELKMVADYVTDAIDQDGIRNACLHLGLI